MFFPLPHLSHSQDLPTTPLLEDTDSAVCTATDALNAASAGIEDIPEESRNDAAVADLEGKGMETAWRGWGMLGVFVSFFGGKNEKKHEKDWLLCCMCQAFLMKPPGTRSFGTFSCLYRVFRQPFLTHIRGQGLFGFGCAKRVGCVSWRLGSEEICPKLQRRSRERLTYCCFKSFWQSRQSIVFFLVKIV